MTELPEGKGAKEMDSKEYYVRFENGTIDGPFSVNTIRGFVASGKLTLAGGVVEAKGQSLSALRRLAEWTTIGQLLDGAGGTIQITPVGDVAAPQDRRLVAVIVVVVGAVATLWAVVRLNSIESAFMRATGHGDPGGFLALVIGILAIIIGNGNDRPTLAADKQCSGFLERDITDTGSGEPSC